MPVAIELPEDVRFTVSPLVELGWAGHVLCTAGHHPERAEWVADVAAPAGLGAWAFTMSAVRATVLADPTVVPVAPLPEQAAWLARMPADEFAAAMLRPLLRVRGRPAARDAELPRLARARGAETARVVRLLVDEPVRARAEFVDLVESCWHGFFAEEWTTSAPALHAEVAARTRLAARDGVAAALRTLAPSVRIDAGRLVVDKVQSKRVPSAGGLVLTPTRFAGPHVYVADEPGRPVVVHYPVSAPNAAADRLLTVRRLAALAHPVRLEVCRAIAVEPRSAREIARLWHLSDTTVTKHLTTLRAAGLVESARAGHFVRYSLRADAIGSLGSDVLEVLLR